MRWPSMRGLPPQTPGVLTCFSSRARRDRWQSAWRSLVRPLGELPRLESLLRLPEHIVGYVEGRLADEPVSRLVVVEEAPRLGLFEDGERAGYAETTTLGHPRTPAFIQ